MAALGRHGTRRDAELADDRSFVDLPDRRCGQRRHRDQLVGSRMRGHTTPVKVAVQLRKRNRSSSENDCSADFFPQILVR